MISVITNLAYLAAGIIVAAKHPAYGISLMALGVASAGFHAGWGRGWQAADECGMYVALCALSALWGVPPVLAAVCAAALIVGHERLSSFTWVPALVAANVVLIALRDPGLAVAVAIVGAVAYAVRQAAEKEDSDAGHGIWHVLTALALGAAVP